MRTGTMMRLSDSDQILADPEQDIRGRTVVDREGNEIGKVGDLLIDPEQKRVRLLRVEHGGLFGIGATPLFIPVETVERITDDLVGIDRTRGEIAGAPQYDPELIDGQKYMDDLYSHYGHSPYWAPGYMPPARGFFR
jgi:sporulation protein YlmC with PRC-barrel domain